MSSETLNSLATGLIVSIVFGGLFCIIIVCVAAWRRRKGVSVSMMRGSAKVAICVIPSFLLYAAGYEAFGAGAIVIGFFWGLWSLNDKHTSSGE